MTNSQTKVTPNNRTIIVVYHDPMPEAESVQLKNRLKEWWLNGQDDPLILSGQIVHSIEVLQYTIND